MEDAKLQKLYDTLNKLRPKGHAGLGAFSGGAKKTDDGLPKNGLYCYFVREGNSGYKKWGEDQEEEAAASSEGGAGMSKEERKRLKKAKKERREQQQEEEEPASADTEDGKDAKDKRRKKRQRERGDEESQGGEQLVAGTEAGQAEEGTNPLEFNWAKHIQKVIKKADRRQMPVKELQKAVIVRAMEVYQDGMRKKHFKKIFKQHVTTLKTVVVQDGLALYSKGRSKEVTVVEEETEMVVEEEEEEVVVVVPPKKQKEDEKKRDKKRQKREKQQSEEEEEMEVPQEEEEGETKVKKSKKKSKSKKGEEVSS